MTTTTSEVEYLEQLHRLEGREPDVDLDARWGLTVRGLQAVVGSVDIYHDRRQPPHPCAFFDEPVIFRHGRWIVVPR